MSKGAEIKEVVKERYGQAAARVRLGATSCCGGGGSALADCCDPITSNLYSEEEGAGVPEAALRASLGCGNPTALARLNPGETVLDLGSGGGIDVLLSARRVGPSGKAYGLDMTDEMLALARENQKKAGVENVEFLKGEIESIPLPDNSVDVIISNCVINLSADKDRVFREAFRVLKPGGRLAVSDVVVRGEMPAEVQKSVELWVGCIAGALRDTDYISKLKAAGFEGVEIEPTRIYTAEDARQSLSGQGVDVDCVATQMDGKFMSAFVRAVKAGGKAPGALVDSGGLRERAEVVAVADDGGGRDQHQEAAGDQRFGSAAGASPFVQRDAPQGAEDDDAGHVQGPTGELVRAHLRLAHGVEEELEIPGDAGEGGEEVVVEQGHAGGLAGYGDGGGRGHVLDHLFAGRIDGGLDDGGAVIGRVAVAQLGGEVLVSGAIPDVQRDAPDEVRGESAEQDDDQHGQALP